jgi:hypothetical protein
MAHRGRTQQNTHILLLLSHVSLSHPPGFLPESSNTQRLVARQPELWPQHFAFLSAVAADASVACSHVMTDRSRLAGGALYLVLADQAGRLYFFTPQGQLLHEYDTGGRRRAAAPQLTAVAGLPCVGAPHHACCWHMHAVLRSTPSDDLPHGVLT